MDRNSDIFLGFLFFLLVIVFPVTVVTVFSYKQAESESKLYNETYGKSYTAADFFFAGQTIKDYLNKGQNTTVNLNADLKTK